MGRLGGDRLVHRWGSLQGATGMQTPPHQTAPPSPLSAIRQSHHMKSAVIVEALPLLSPPHSLPATPPTATVSSTSEVQLPKLSGSEASLLPESTRVLRQPRPCSAASGMSCERGTQGTRLTDSKECAACSNRERCAQCLASGLPAALWERMGEHKCVRQPRPRSATSGMSCKMQGCPAPCNMQGCPACPACPA